MGLDNVADIIGMIPVSLREAALTHSSYAGEHPGTEDNQRLEFLGDAVIGLICASYLYRKFPDYPEGKLSVIKSVLISTAVLAQKARNLALDSQIRLGLGEEKNGGRNKDSILADTYEALVGAAYLSRPWAEVERLVMVDIASFLPTVTKDAKSQLQEVWQARTGRYPHYKVISSYGPDHEKTFIVEVSHAGRVLGRGCGGSKKEAEQKAAAEALKNLQLPNTT